MLIGSHLRSDVVSKLGLQADPATVVVRHSRYFQAMFYAFNRSFVTAFLQPYIIETNEKVDHDTNCHGIPDWSECLARQGWKKCTATSTSF